jgi:hypothetical protein
MRGELTVRAGKPILGRRHRKVSGVGGAESRVITEPLFAELDANNTRRDHRSNPDLAAGWQEPYLGKAGQNGEGECLARSTSFMALGYAPKASNGRLG